MTTEVRESIGYALMAAAFVMMVKAIATWLKDAIKEAVREALAESKPEAASDGAEDATGLQGEKP